MMPKVKGYHKPRLDNRAAIKKCLFFGNYSPVIPAKAGIQARFARQLTQCVMDPAVKPRDDEVSRGMTRCEQLHFLINYWIPATQGAAHYALYISPILQSKRCDCRNG